MYSINYKLIIALLDKLINVKKYITVFNNGTNCKQKNFLEKQLCIFFVSIDSSRDFVHNYDLISIQMCGQVSLTA